jgi:probable HAF family extracellular repeat protein
MGKTLTRFFAALCATVSLAGAPSLAGATSYTLFDLGILGAPGEWHTMHATGLNNSGQVVGYASYFSVDTQGAWTETTQAWVTGANGIGMTAIPTLGGAWNRANGINDAGWVVGTSLTASGSERAFVTGPGGTSPRELGTLGGTSSTASAINASGQVVGTSTTAAGLQRGYLSDAQAGNLHDLGSLHESSPTGMSVPTAINAAGQVTGMSRATNYGLDDTERPFITGPNGTSMREITVAGAAPGTPGEGFAINASGQTVGQMTPFHYYRDAFFAEADGSGRLLKLPIEPEGGESPAYLNSWATGLNASGQVVGSYFMRLESGLFVTGPYGSNPMLLDQQAFTGLTEPLPVFDDALAINDAGQIIASARSNGHVYLISPVPEPAVVAMMLAGLGLLAVRRRQYLTKEIS